MEAEAKSLSRNDMDFLYDDLEEDIYHQRDEKLEEKLKKLTEETNFYKNENLELKNLVKEQNKTIAGLKRNISSLYLTSKRELDRKTEQMKALSEELDRYILSKMRPSKRAWREEESYFPKKFKRDGSRDSRESVPINTITKTATKHVHGDSTNLRKEMKLQRVEPIQTVEQKRDGNINLRKQSEANDTFIHKIEPIQNDCVNIEMRTERIQEDNTSSVTQSKPNDTVNCITKEIHNDKNNTETATTTERVQERNNSLKNRAKRNDTLNSKIEGVQNEQINFETITATTERVVEGGINPRNESNPNNIHSCKIIPKENDENKTETMIKQPQEDSTKSRKENNSNSTCKYKSERVQLHPVPTAALTITQGEENAFTLKKENETDHNHNKNVGSDRIDDLQQIELKIDKTTKEDQNNHRADSQRSTEVNDKGTVGKEVALLQNKGAEQEVSDLIKSEKNQVWRIPKIVNNGEKQIRGKKDHSENLRPKENTTDQGNSSIKEENKYAIRRSDRFFNSQKIEHIIDEPAKNHQNEAESKRNKKVRNKQTAKEDMPESKFQVSDHLVKPESQLSYGTQKIEKKRTQSERINKVKRPIWKGDATDCKQIQKIIREGIVTSEEVQRKIDEATKSEQSSNNENCSRTQSEQSKAVCNEETAGKDMIDCNQSSATELDKADSLVKAARPSAYETQRIEKRTTESERRKRDETNQKEPEIKEDAMGNNQHQGSQISTIRSDKIDNSSDIQHKIDKRTEDSNNKETTKTDMSEETDAQECDSQKKSDGGEQQNKNETLKQRSENGRSKKVEYEKPNQEERRSYNRKTPQKESERSERRQRGSDQERQNHNYNDKRRKEDDLRKRIEHNAHKRHEEDYRKRFVEVQKRYLDNDRKRSDCDAKKYTESDRKRYQEYDRRRWSENDRKRNEDVRKRCETVDPRKCKEYDRNRFDNNRRFKEDTLKNFEDRKRREGDSIRYEEGRRRFREDRRDFLRRNYDSHDSRNHRTVFEERWPSRLTDDQHKSNHKNGAKDSDSSSRNGGESPKAPFTENMDTERSGVESIPPSVLLSLPEDHLEELLKSRQEKLKRLEEMEKQPSLPNLSEDNTLLDSCADQWDTNVGDEWIPLNKEEKRPIDVLNSNETSEEHEKNSVEPAKNADLQKPKGNERSVNREQKSNKIEVGHVQETANDKINKMKLISELLISESAKLTFKKGHKSQAELKNTKTSPELNSTNQFEKSISGNNKCENNTGKKRNAHADSPCISKKQKMESTEDLVLPNKQKNVNETISTAKDVEGTNIEPKLDMTRKTKEVEIEPDIEINNVKDTENIKVSKNVKSASKTKIIELEDIIDSPVIGIINSQNSNGPCANENLSTIQSFNDNFKSAIGSNPEILTDAQKVERNSTTIRNEENVINCQQTESNKVNNKKDNNKSTRKVSFEENVQINPTATLNVIDNAKKKSPRKPVKNSRITKTSKPKTQKKSIKKASSKAKTGQSKRNTTTGKNHGIEMSLEVALLQNETPVRKSPRLLQRKQTQVSSTQLPNLDTSTYETECESVQNVQTMKCSNRENNMVYSIFGSMDSIISELDKETKPPVDSSVKCTTPANTPSVIILSDIVVNDGNSNLMNQIGTGAKKQCIKQKETIENAVSVESMTAINNTTLNKSAENVVITTSCAKKPSGSVSVGTNKSPKKKVTFDSEPQRTTPSTVTPRRRITPIRVPSDPTLNMMSCSSISGLKLTHDGEIPLLNIEEKHFSGVSTEGIQENSIMHLLHTMNVLNFENETLRFQSNLGSDLNTSIDSVADLTFSNFMEKISSTPVTIEACLEGTEEGAVQLSICPTTPSTSRTSSRDKKRRCKLLMFN